MRFECGSCGNEFNVDIIVERDEYYAVDGRPITCPFCQWGGSTDVRDRPEYCFEYERRAMVRWVAGLLGKLSATHDRYSLALATAGELMRESRRRYKTLDDIFTFTREGVSGDEPMETLHGDDGRLGAGAGQVEPARGEGG